MKNKVLDFILEQNGEYTPAGEVIMSILLPALGIFTVFLFSAVIAGVYTLLS